MFTQNIQGSHFRFGLDVIPIVVFSRGIARSDLLRDLTRWIVVAFSIVGWDGDTKYGSINVNFGWILSGILTILSVFSL